MVEFRRKKKKIINKPANKSINKPSKENLPVINKEIPKITNATNGNNRNGNGKLTAKQAKFVDEYLVDLNATQAAIRAGYSKNGAHVQGSLLLSNIKVGAIIAKRRQELTASTQLNQEYVLTGYRRLLEFDRDDTHNDDHTLKPVSQMSKNAKYAVQESEVLQKTSSKVLKDGTPVTKTETIQKIKFCNKKDVLDKVGEHLGMFKKDGDSPGGNTFIGPTQINVRLVKSSDR